MRQRNLRFGMIRDKRKRYLLSGGIWVFIILLNVLAWKSTYFCDFYVDHIYPLWVNTYGRMMGIFPFSVGEIMVLAGTLSAAAALFFVIGDIIVRIFGSCSISRIRRFCKKYLTVFGWIFTGAAMVMTLNCFIPYHCSALEEKYGILCRETEKGLPAEDLSAREYTLEELVRLRDYVVIKSNELAEQVERDEAGNIIYPKDMEGTAIACMQELSRDCVQLEGYYPRPKQFTFSGFFSQQKMKGYFFPFSMEVNYNKLMHEINRPATICHEYAHLKGFMYEEEANMIGFLACIRSSEPSFRYSGYLSVLNYVDNEFYKAIGKDKEVYLSHVNISPQVRKENIFLEKDVWDQVEARAVMKTEVVDKVSDKLSETSMKLNGVEDGTLSYTRVVGLLLHYYDGSGEVEETLLRAESIPSDTEVAMGSEMQ